MFWGAGEGRALPREEAVVGGERWLWVNGGSGEDRGREEGRGDMRGMPGGGDG